MGWMKKFLGILLIPFTLVAGFALSVAALYTIVVLLGCVFIELTFNTIENPTVWMFVADTVCLALFIYVITRRAIRSSFSGFLKQVLRNM